MEIFKNTNFDFLGKKAPFIGLSVLLIAAGLASLIAKGGPRYGIDFAGGTVTSVMFAKEPNEDQIRGALAAKVGGEISVQRVVGTREVIIGTELKSEGEMEQARKNMTAALYTAFGGNPETDFHAMGAAKVVDKLQDPLQKASAGVSTDGLQTLAKAVLDYRDTPPRSGLIASFDDLKNVPAMTQPVIDVMKKELTLAPFAIRSFELVGPKIGEELRWQAIQVTLLALAGMLVYIAFRFEWIYGIAAVIAVFHDTVITIGLFSLFNKEITLPVVAALLTLVGYSMNDTIVVFDRIRESLHGKVKASFSDIVNTSINQTLSRTVLTSGLTFLSVLALWIFGGQVLNGFSFALVVGIIVGTYSSIFIASPILIFWQNMLESRKKASGAQAPEPAKPSPAKPPARPAARREKSAK
ncbi:MAG: protein translocase subunit SecF [Acidobacteria bacterium]|nr:protein translocase subunit SecF [Acidobacteriota bacterium]